MSMTTYKVSGMTCEGCVHSITAALQAAIPDATVTVDLAAGKVRVDGAADAAAIKDAVEAAGFDFEGACA